MKKLYSLFPASGDMTLPLVFDSPHSGRIYPDDFNYSCDNDSLVQAEDNYIDDLFDSVPDYGGVLLAANFPRTYIDVNRAIDDIDPQLLSEEPPVPIKPTSRSRAGIGLIRRILKPGTPVYDRALKWQEIRKRIENYYKPYHVQLKSLIESAHYNFGAVWHINCHSMPSRPARPYTIPALDHLPDFVLGDRDATSCDLDFRNALRDFLLETGYSVAVNDPYKGVEILKRYGTPAAGYHSLQIEVNKRLYWDEDEGCRTKNYGVLKEDIGRLIEFTADYAAYHLPTRLAAD